MKSIVSLIIFTISLLSFGQTKTIVSKGKIEIPIKKEIHLKTKIKKGKIETFEIISEKDISKPFDFMKVIDKKPSMLGDIIIQFNPSDFGVLLVFIHKSKKPLTFKAKIKIKGVNKLFETSINPKYPNVIATEQWNDDLEMIELYDFKHLELD